MPVSAKPRSDILHLDEGGSIHESDVRKTRLRDGRWRGMPPDRRVAAWAVISAVEVPVEVHLLQNRVRVKDELQFSAWGG